MSWWLWHFPYYGYAWTVQVSLCITNLSKPTGQMETSFISGMVALTYFRCPTGISMIISLMRPVSETWKCMWKYPNVSPVLLGQGLSNSMGKSPNESTEKNVCSVTLSMQSNDKWRDDGGKGSGFAFLPLSPSIQLTTKFYSFLFLNIPQVHSLSVSSATISIQATVIICLNDYCSLLTGPCLPVSP